MSIPIGYLSKGNERHTSSMDMERIYEERRKRLLSAARERFDQRGMQKDLADILGCAPNYISRVLSHPSKPQHKKIGEEMARHIEETLGKPMYWLDGTKDQSQWPFKRVTPDRLLGMDASEIERLETVLETTLVLMEQGRPPAPSPPHSA